MFGGLVLPAGIAFAKEILEMVPIVEIEQLYSFDRDTLIKAIPKQGMLTEKEFAAEELCVEPTPTFCNGTCTSLLDDPNNSGALPGELSRWLLLRASA